MRRPTRTILMPTIVVFCAVILLVGISFFMARNSVKQEINTEVHNYIKETEDTTSERLNVFEVTLRAGIGLVSGNPSVNEAQWKQFINTSNVLERYPSSRSINYAKVIKQADVPAFTTDMQTKATSDYHVYPDSSDGTYVPITFLDKDSPENLKYFGFDLSADPVRKVALERARDTGQITLSDPVRRPLDTSQTPFAFIMFIPQYKTGAATGTIEQRRQALEGFAYASFNVDTFAQGISSVQKDKKIAFLVRNGDTGHELYRSAEYNNVLKGKYQATTSLMHIGSTTLNVSYVYNPNTLLPTYVAQRPTAIAVFGLMVAMLIALTIWLVLASKANELLLDQERGINDAKDNLLSLASHQLRTPATGVKQYLGLLLQGFAGDVSPRQHDIIEKAYEGNERQLKTINDILYLARLGSGRIVLTKTAFSMRSLINDVVLEMSDEIEEKQHKITIKAPKRQQKFVGDEHMIRMAVENLLTNAVKYTHKKGRISILASVSKGEMRLSVEDNGVGIPEDQQEHMFQQFVRLDNELSIAVGGTGIGLYVVKNIVDLHDGRVEVTSQVGKGSKFTLILPMKRTNKTDKV
jgi:signal transduction histidine kinase